MGVLRVNTLHREFTNIHPQPGGSKTPGQAVFLTRRPHVVHSPIHRSSTPRPRLVPSLSSSSSTGSAVNSFIWFDWGHSTSLPSAGRSPRDNEWMCARGRRASTTRPGGFTFRLAPRGSLSQPWQASSGCRTLVSLVEARPPVTQMKEVHHVRTRLVGHSDRDHRSGRGDRESAHALERSPYRSHGRSCAATRGDGAADTPQSS